MTTIEAAKLVVEESSCKLLRRRKEDTKDAQGKIIPQYDVKDAFTGKKKNWFYLDLFTASAIMAVYNAASDETKAIVPRIPITKIAEFAFGHIR